MKKPSEVAAISEVLEKLMVGTFIIDGLDGSGKGEITERIKRELEKLGYDPISIDFPRYDLDSGKRIREELKNPKLNIMQRLNLYALNRLEGFRELLLKVRDSVEQGKKPFVIFDRFTTSNLISIAYELSKTNPELANATPEELSTMSLNVGGIDLSLELIFGQIINLENQFLDYLNLNHGFKVIIPEISPDITLDRIDKDTSRGNGTNNRDAYEQKPVQQISANLYRAVELIWPGTFVFIDQKGRTPDEIVEEIMQRFVIDERANQEMIKQILDTDIAILLGYINDWKISPGIKAGQADA